MASNNKAVFLKKYAGRTKEKVGKVAESWWKTPERLDVEECKHKQIVYFPPSRE
jgi:hypothetical protein